ncbi:peptide deformylase [Caldichromatium japonicum]|uniref:Peptide deformylase n=1 Tax=Caldichromatium japonicum TaxID=2699430 RepID=A0A6G7VBN7_9GAMM|nr:peptide deformylase [Caldichromatium japonicum]QIK37286.1 peptide deformylase [Caldichromatium japonicum]
MALREILTFPDPRLRKKAQPVKQVDDGIRRLVDDMLETMYAAPGIGLAATQIDVQLQVVVIDVSETHDQPLCLINPRILAREGTTQREEGCLSVPGFYEPVARAERVTVEALDREGQTFRFEADGLLAICIQHELDHLDGKLFVDHISLLKRQRIRHKLEKQRKERQASALAQASAAQRRQAI